MSSIIADFPAYSIHAPEPGREYADGDVIAILDASRRFARFYTLGSVAAYAERYGDDPAEAVRRAIDNGHELYYAFGNGALIHDGPVVKEHVPGFEYGDRIRFAGLTFTIEPARNNNIRLAAV